MTCSCTTVNRSSRLNPFLTMLPSGATLNGFGVIDQHHLDRRIEAVEVLHQGESYLFHEAAPGPVPAWAASRYRPRRPPRTAARRGRSRRLNRPQAAAREPMARTAMPPLLCLAGQADADPV